MESSKVISPEREKDGLLPKKPDIVTAFSFWIIYIFRGLWSPSSPAQSPVARVTVRLHCHCPAIFGRVTVVVVLPFGVGTAEDVVVKPGIVGAFVVVVEVFAHAVLPDVEGVIALINKIEK
jgi:hypothetical protein